MNTYSKPDATYVIIEGSCPVAISLNGTTESTQNDYFQIQSPVLENETKW